MTLTKPQILVVDDSPVIMRIIEVTLRETADVTLCEDPRQALQLGLAREWDLAIVDLAMPTLSGLELAARWREQGARHPVVVLSGYEQPEDGLPEGVAVWVVKPFTPADLRQLVGRFTRAA